MSIVSGAAHGLARIHEESNNNNDAKICHGNVKSSNILVDKNGVACISDFGLALLLPPIEATSRLGGYRAPEQAQSRKLSQKADVYSFGVLLLEIVTGRDPLRSSCDGDDGEGGVGVDVAKWVREEWTAEVFDTELMRYKGIEEEMVALLQVAVACVAEQPEKRPSMGEVGKMVEEIMRVVQSPLDESTSPSLAVTEDSRASC